MFEGLFGGASNCDKWISVNLKTNQVKKGLKRNWEMLTLKGKGKGYTAISASEGS